MRNRTLSLLLAVGLLAALAAVPVAQADLGHPREIQASACNSVKIGERGYVLFRKGVSCTFAKRWVRKLAATRGASKPSGFTCTSGSKFRSGGYCAKGSKHFGWHSGD